MFLILRGQNYASGAIRSVERDMQRLGRTSGVAGRQMTAGSMMAQRAWMRVGIGSSILRDVGRQARMAGIMTGAGLGVAAKSAIDWERDVTRVATQTGKVGTSMVTVAKNAEFLSDALLDVAADSTSSLAQVNEAAYDLFSTFDQLSESGGLRGLKTGVKMLKLMSDASVAGRTDIEQVTNGVVAVMTAWESGRHKIPLSVKGINQALNTLFAAVRFGRMDFGEFTNMLGTTAPAAKAAGQSLETMAGTVAFLSRPLGINKAAIGFARLSEMFGRKKFVEGTKAIGIQIADASGKFLRFDKIVENIVRKRPDILKSDVALLQFFKDMSGTEGTIQMRRAFVFLARDLKRYREVLGLVRGDQNEFNRSLGAMSKQPAVRWEKFLNKLRTGFIRLGKEAVPEILKVTEPLQKVIDWFGKLDAATRKSIAHWAVYGTALLLVGGTLAALVGGMLNVIALFGQARILLPIVLGIMLALGAASRDNAHAAAIMHDGFEKAFNGIYKLISKLAQAFLHVLPAAISGFADFAVSNIRNFILATGLATAAVLRLSKVMVGSFAIQKGVLGLMAASAVGGFLTRGNTAQIAAREAEKQAVRSTIVNAGLSSGWRKAEVAALGAAASISLQAKAVRGLREAVEKGKITQAAATRATANAMLTQRRAANFNAKYSKSLSNMGKAGLLAERSALRLAAGGAKARGVLKGVGLAAMMLPGPLKLAIPIIAAVGAGLFLMGRRAAAARARLEELKDTAATAANDMNIFNTAVKVFGTQGMGAGDVIAARDAVASYDAEIKALDKTMKKQKGAALAASQRELNALLLGRLVATKDWRKANLASNLTIVAQNDALNQNRKIVAKVAAAEKNLAAAKARAAHLALRDPTFMDFKQSKMWADAEQAVKKYTIQLAILKTSLKPFREEYFRIVRDMQALRLFDEKNFKMPKIPAQAIADLFKYEMKKGPLSIPQKAEFLKAWIQIEVDPKAKKRAATDIDRFINAQKRKRVLLELSQIRQPGFVGPPPKAPTGIEKFVKQTVKVVMEQKALNKAKELQSNIAAIFKPWIPQTIALRTNIAAFTYGQQIARGIKEGIESMGPAFVKVSTWIVEKPMAKGIIAESPSRLAAQVLGVPTAEGWIKGILDKSADFEKTAYLVVDLMRNAFERAEPIGISLFAGDFIQQLEAQTKELSEKETGRLKDLQAKLNLGKKLSNAQLASMRELEQRQKAKPIGITGLLEDTRRQVADLQKFSTAMKLLAKAGFSNEMLGQLRELGLGGAKYLFTLATAGKKAQDQIKALLETAKKLGKDRAMTAADVTAGWRKSATEAKRLNDNLGKLKGRISARMWEELANNAEELAPIIAILAKTHGKAFADMIAALRAYMKESKRSVRETIEDKNARIKAAKEEEAERRKNVTQGLADLYNSIRGTLEQGFGALFAGPTNLADMIGTQFDDAMKAYEESAKDLADTIKSTNKELGEAQLELATIQQDAAKEIAQVQKDAAKEMAQAQAEIAQMQLDWAEDKRQNFKTAFGQLFEGVENEWGTTMNALQTNLDKQLAKFEEWRSLVAQLGAKVPTSLLDELEALGPEALDKLRALNSATGGQLSQYIDTWEKSQAAVAKAADKSTTGLADLQERMAERMADAQERMAEAQSRIVEITAETAQRMFDAQVHINELLQQIQDATEKLAALNRPHALTPEDIIKDLQAQQDAFGIWQTTIQKLRDLKLPADIVQQLANMGPEAVPYLQALVAMTAPQLASFVALWTTTQNQIALATEAMMEDQLAAWRQHGINIAQALVEGVESQYGILTDFFRNMMLELLGQEGGFTGGGGVAIGGREEREGGGGTKSSYKPQPTTPPVTMNITAVSDETLQSTLSRASFQLRTLYE